jgi:hypothetical protein
MRGTRRADLVRQRALVLARDLQPHATAAQWEAMAFYLAAVACMAELESSMEAWASKQDDMSDMGQEMSMRLQQAMDRFSIFSITLSNMLKKMSDTSSGIVANLK